MNKQTIGIDSKQLTPIQNDVGWAIDFNVPRSHLLAENSGQSSFTSMNLSTQLQRKTWLEESTLSDLTGEYSPKRVQNVGWHKRDEIDQVNSAAERAINDRVTLLARKYAEKSTLSAEENARLAIATEKVRVLVPAVTDTQEQILNEALLEIRKIANDSRDIRNRLLSGNKKIDG